MARIRNDLSHKNVNKMWSQAAVSISTEEETKEISKKVESRKKRNERMVKEGDINSKYLHSVCCKAVLRLICV